MATRADLLTEILKKKEIYSDFPTNFDSIPGTETLTTITNENSVITSVKNLILTNLGERPFQPTIGSHIYRMLFEIVDQNSVFAIENITNEIRRTIEANEPRAQLLDVKVSIVPDTHDASVNIIFAVINKIEPIQLNVILKRVR